MISALALLLSTLAALGCGRGSTPPEDSSPEDSAPEDSAPPPPVDADGDGVLSDVDCDDTDPLAWLPDSPIEPSDSRGLQPQDYREFCAGYCARTLLGDLELPNSRPELSYLADLRCLRELTGSMVSGGALPDTGLGALTRLERVGGDLRLENEPALASLAGLSALREVGGDLVLSELPAIDSLAGLQALESVGGALTLQSMPRLGHAANLSSLQRVGGDLTVSVSAWQDLTPLSALRSLGGTLTLTNNPLLAELTGVEELASPGGGVVLERNELLEDISALAQWPEMGQLGLYDLNLLRDLSPLLGLEIVRGDLSFVGLPLIRQLELPALEQLTGQLNLSYNAALEGLAPIPGLSATGGLLISSNPRLSSLAGLSALTRVRGDLRVLDNAALPSFDGLAALAVIEGDLVVSDNGGLLALAGPEQLRLVGPRLSLNGNPLLARIDLPALHSVGEEIYVLDNEALCAAEIEAFLAQLVDYEGSVSQRRNGVDCAE